MASQSTVATGQPSGPAARGASGALLARGIHKISAAVYHADPCPRPSLSSSLAHLIVSRSPRHAWLAHPRLNPDFLPEHSTQFDLGTAAHLALLEGAAPFELIDAPNWKSEAARDDRAAVYRLGKVPLLEKEWSRVQALVRSVRIQLKQHKDAKFAFRRGKAERTLIWRDGDIWCRIRCDWLLAKRSGALEIYDFKTTAGSAAPQTWAAQMWSLGGAIQAAFYRRGALALYPQRTVIFRFVVAELDPPHGVSVVTLSPEAEEIADYQVEEAIEAWAWCQKRQSWPGYAARTFSADAPAWLSKEIENQKLQRAMDRDRKIDPFRLSIQLWKP